MMTMVEKFNNAAGACGCASHEERATALMFCKIADICDEFADDAEHRYGEEDGERQSDEFFRLLTPALEFLQDRCSFPIMALAEML